jgi:DNA polymerase I
VVKWAKPHAGDIFICTSDKDLCQLVDNQVKVLNTHKDNLLIDQNKVEEIYGVPPEKIVDMLAIMGDSSDNVPGLSGFGPKTAASLLQQFGSLDEILAHPEKVPGKKKQETIVAEKDLALISRQLVTLNSEVPVPHEIEFYRIKHPHVPELKQFYHAMSFSSLLKETEQSLPKGEEEKTAYRLIDSEEAFQQLLTFLGSQKEICFDTETTALSPLNAELVGVGFAVQPGEAWYVPLNGRLDPARILNGLKPLLENKAIGFYGQNIKYDMHVMMNAGITIANICFDTMIASYLLNAHRRQHSLDQLALEYFDKVKIATSDLIGKGKGQITMREVPVERVCEYCCEDVDYTCRLKLLFEKELEERKLKPIFQTVEMPLVKVLVQMERNGIYLDQEHLKTISIPIINKIKTVEQEIYQMAGEEFNLNSPKQMSDILFIKLGIPPPKKSKSTSADVLAYLTDGYPIAEKILEYRTLEKLRSTYLEILPTQINPKTGRIHCTFNQTGTATGRLSCQDPNLQNIPIRTEIGRQIREAFRPQKKGWSYLGADYSQVELRLLAHFSEDPNLLEAFHENRDVHAHTAAKIYGIPIEEVTREMRNQAKAVNFGLMYGQQSFGLAQQLRIDTREADAFIKMYFKQYPKVKSFIESSIAHARKTGKTVTYLGRERPIPEITSGNYQIRSAAERLAINTPIQGSQADLIKLAMLKIDQSIKKHHLHAKMILQIHDELIFELPDHEVEQLKPLVREAMISVMALKVPLIVDIAVGKNWKEC